MSQRLLYIVNSPDFFLSHRIQIAISARSAGFDVHVATGNGRSISEIVDAGFIHHTLPLTRSGKNLANEIRSIFSIYTLIKRIKPDIVHLVTIKPILYGGIAAKLASVQGVVFAISGLGSVFTGRSRKARRYRNLVKFLYKIAFSHRNKMVIFQNEQDNVSLADIGVTDSKCSVLIRGSGVVLEDYPVSPEPEGVPVITFASRLINDKGVQEFVAAAKLLKLRGVIARFWLIGSPDPGNPSSITQVELGTWKCEGIVEVMGYRKDIPELFSKSNIITLPSYYGEGLPKVLIEAAASARAVVTTDHPGCRDAIIPNITGLLVPVRDVTALANAIQSLIIDQQLRHRMGRAGRKLAEKDYAIENVITTHLEIYRSMLNYERNP